MEKTQEPVLPGSSSIGNQKPVRGILKPQTTTNTSVAQAKQASEKKSQRWDEMNIIATYHPPDKDYGLMKVDEPSTPFHRFRDDGSEEDRPTGGTFLDPITLTPELLAERLAAMDGITPKALQAAEGLTRTSQAQETSEGREDFLAKRKAHYNEGRHLSVARTTQDREDRNKNEPWQWSSDGIHLRLAQKLLEQERNPKDDPEDMEVLAPILSPRSSGGRGSSGYLLQGKEASTSIELPVVMRQSDLKGDILHPNVPTVPGGMAAKMTK
ncbi:protein phosphatase inhibitor 2-like isoform X2 [Ambystoma mexicanum]|uniref:protein phosphatase inhibitor 2-like isoform X2 n=1 Tax=Ambystoma mexicanum TaxID=8296 RepID=UPI0037E825CD